MRVEKSIFVIVTFLASFCSLCEAQLELQDLGNDHITEAPPTIYEDAEISAQNMDFDKDNNMFIAHAGWYNDRLIHYYKFRMYAPSTYPSTITLRSSYRDVPVQDLYIVTTTGDLQGAIGNPILSHHTSDGEDYSDFMEIIYVVLPANSNYAADMFRSVGDILANTANGDDENGVHIHRSDIIVNLPVVPTGSKLQHPHDTSTTAPISPTMVWYKGVPVQTFVFEVTEQEAGDYFASTREDNDNAYAITVNDYASTNVTTATDASGNLVPHHAVVAIPIYHLNQYTRGVVVGENGGGPNPAGMRNVINLDRVDRAYSPLWQISWVTELPIDYEADMASNINKMTRTNGFDFVMVPMFVNCPNIGNVGENVNSQIADEYQTEIDIMDSNSNSWWILGSDRDVIMKPDIAVSFQVFDSSGVMTEIGTAQTNMMGAYQYELRKADIPDWATEIEVVIDNDSVRKISFASSTETPSSSEEIPSSSEEAPSIDTSSTSSETSSTSSETSSSSISMIGINVLLSATASAASVALLLFA